jgi:hypothetical protein
LKWTRVADGDTSQEATDQLDKASRDIGISPEGRAKLIAEATAGPAPREIVPAQGVEPTRGSEALEYPDYDEDDALLGIFSERDASYGDLTTDEYDRVVKKLDAIKKQAAADKRPLSAAISDYLSQSGLFGQELSDRQQALLRELATRARRAAVTVEQGSLFGDISPTVESETERRQSEQVLAPQGGLFGEAGPQYETRPDADRQLSLDLARAATADTERAAATVSGARGTLAPVRLGVDAGAGGIARVT